MTMMDKYLSKGFKASQGRLIFDDGEVVQDVANFVPEVTKVERVLSDNEEEVVFLRLHLSLHFCDKDATVRVVRTLKELESVDFQSEIDSRCRVYSQKSKKGHKMLLHLIRDMVAEKEGQDVLLLTKPGYHMHEGTVFYAAGTTIIGTPKVHLEFAPNMTKFRLERKNNDEGVMNYLNQLVGLCEPVTPTMFAFLITSLLRRPFEDAGVPVKFCLYLYGQSQTFKTTFLSLFLLIYNRQSDPEYGVHNLTGTTAYLHHALNEEHDMVSIIDDLNLSDSMTQMRTQDAKISEIIRVAANGIGRETMREQNQIGSVVAFAGEYLLNNVSTNNRLVILDMDSVAIDKERLASLQRQPLVLTTFVYEFVKWIVENYKEVLQVAKEDHGYYLQARATQEIYQERLNASAHVLCLAYSIFLKFAVVKGWSIELGKRKFNELMETVVYDQIDLLMLDGEDEVDLVYELYAVTELFFRMNEKYDCEESLRINRAVFLDRKSGLLYIPGPVMFKMVEHIEAKGVSLHAVVCDLYDKGLLVTDKNKARSKTKKKFGVRCYVIRYFDFKEYAKEKAFEEQEDEECA